MVGLNTIGKPQSLANLGKRSWEFIMYKERRLMTEKIICPSCGKDWSGDEGKQNFANIDVIYCFTSKGGCGHKSPKSECLQPKSVDVQKLRYKVGDVVELVPWEEAEDKGSVMKHDWPDRGEIVGTSENPTDTLPYMISNRRSPFNFYFAESSIAGIAKPLTKSEVSALLDTVDTREEPTAEPHIDDMVYWKSVSWSDDTAQYMGKLGGEHIVRLKNGLVEVDDVSLTDPSIPEEPDTPDWLPEDCELWPRNVASGGYPVMYKSPGIGNRYTHAVLEDPRLIGFAIENGRGGVDIRNSPLWYTDGRGNYASRYGATCDQLATCLGVVMRKGE